MTRESSTGRAAVLDALRDEADPVTAAHLAGRLDVHVNTVRFHLDHLVKDGRIERAPLTAGTPGRPAFGYRVVRQMDRTGPRHFVELARVLTDGLAAEPDGAVRAALLGEAWGAQAAGEPADDGFGRLVELLDDLDFAPETLDEQKSSIGLRHCPFLELAQERSEIVCPIHLGLMQGALREWESDLSVERLEPFVEPDLCLAHVTRTEENR